MTKSQEAMVQRAERYFCRVMPGFIPRSSKEMTAQILEITGFKAADR